MPRLGIPHNIDWVSARFRQPGERLNPLGVRWAMPHAVVLERRGTGSRKFRACWFTGCGRVPLGLPAQSLIPLIVTVQGLFEEQIDAWKAYRCDGQEQPEISSEIQKQLSEFYRRVQSGRRGRGPVLFEGQRVLAGFG